MDTLIICFVGAALLKGIESQPIPNPTTLYMGCYTNIAMDDGMSRYQNNTPALIQPKDCITFCIYSPAGIGTFSYAGIRFIGNSQYCYCFNDVKDNHILSKGAECDTLCFFNDNPVEICKYKNTAKVWSLCPSGFYYPPLCEAQCPDNCLPNGLGLRACGHGGKCAFACRRGICRDSYHCFNVSGLDGISPTPKPSQEFYMPTGTYLFTGMKFTKPGNVTVISFYAKSKGTASVGVWRRSTQTGVAQWILVGKIQVVYNDAPGYFIRELSALEIFYAQVGDIVGIHQDSSAMANKDVFTQKYFTIFSLLQISDPRNTIFTTLYGSGTYLFNPSLYDSNWVVGKSLMESILTPSAMADARFFPDLQLGLDCPCSTGCQKGSCGLRTGSCTQGCIPGLKGPLCDIECSPGWHGSDCQQPCSTNCKSNYCNATTRVCVNGCKISGVGGYLCDGSCAPGSYGLNCMYQCSTNCAVNSTTICDVITGACVTGGCKPGWLKPDCRLPCPSGTYGTDCLQKCGNCLTGVSGCSAIDGYCIGGCQLGFSPPICLDNCPKGSFGASCQYACGHCAQNVVCDIYNGECSKACLPGWLGIDCTIPCDAGYYGTGCKSSCGNCLRTCNNENGWCLGYPQCTIGYRPPMCVNLCPLGTYGPDCNQTCGRCFNDQLCRNYDGICEYGCTGNYKPPFCLCQKYTYGPNCDKICGLCADGADCGDDGVCPNSCALSDYLPPYCVDTYDPVHNNCPLGWYGRKCADMCGLCYNNTQCTPNGTCTEGCVLGYNPPMCTDLCSEGTYGKNCSMICGSCYRQIPCHPALGTCNDCQEGYQLPFCVDKCGTGYYGYMCAFKCGSCAANAVCDFITGYCPTGCQNGYWGELCKGTGPMVDVNLLAAVATHIKASIDCYLATLFAMIIWVGATEMRC